MSQWQRSSVDTPLISKLILAIETCSETCSIALSVNGVSTQLLSTKPRGHADNILPMIEQLLAESEVTLAQLDVIAFSRGPGAFTGVRIGTSVAQGLAVATGLPLIAISSLAVLSQGSYRETGNTRCLAALDARMSEVYFGMYCINDHGLMESIQEDQVAAGLEITAHHEQENISKQNLWQALGPGWDHYPEIMKQRFSQWRVNLPAHLFFPQAIDLLPHGQWHFKAGNLLDAADALPVYVRDEVVKSSN